MFGFDWIGPMLLLGPFLGLMSIAIVLRSKRHPPHTVIVPEPTWFQVDPAPAPYVPQVIPQSAAYVPAAEVADRPVPAVCPDEPEPTEAPYVGLPDTFTAALRRDGYIVRRPREPLGLDHVADIRPPETKRWMPVLHYTKHRKPSPYLRPFAEQVTYSGTHGMIFCSFRPPAKPIDLSDPHYRDVTVLFATDIARWLYQTPLPAIQASLSA